jgi:hypothetical protein
MGAKQKIAEYRKFFGGTMTDAYYELIDMGEVKESDSLKRWCQAIDTAHYGHAKA